jgi:hypothetical protein
MLFAVGEARELNVKGMMTEEARAENARSERARVNGSLEVNGT